jgi:hypothetical protein
MTSTTRCPLCPCVFRVSYATCENPAPHQLLVHQAAFNHLHHHTNTHGHTHAPVWENTHTYTHSLTHHNGSTLTPSPKQIRTGICTNTSLHVQAVPGCAEALTSTLHSADAQAVPRQARPAGHPCLTAEVVAVAARIYSKRLKPPPVIKLLLLQSTPHPLHLLG